MCGSRRSEHLRTRGEFATPCRNRYVRLCFAQGSMRWGSLPLAGARSPGTRPTSMVAVACLWRGSAVQCRAHTPDRNGLRVTLSTRTRTRRVEEHDGRSALHVKTSNRLITTRRGARPSVTSYESSGLVRENATTTSDTYYARTQLGRNLRKSQLERDRLYVSRTYSMYIPMSVPDRSEERARIERDGSQRGRNRPSCVMESGRARRPRPSIPRVACTVVSVITALVASLTMRTPRRSSHSISAG